MSGMRPGTIDCFEAVPAFAAPKRRFLLVTFAEDWLVEKGGCSKRKNLEAWLKDWGLGCRGGGRLEAVP